MYVTMMVSKQVTDVLSDIIVSSNPQENDDIAAVVPLTHAFCTQDHAAWANFLLDQGYKKDSIQNVPGPISGTVRLATSTSSTIHMPCASLLWPQVSGCDLYKTCAHPVKTASFFHQLVSLKESENDY